MNGILHSEVLQVVRLMNFVGQTDILNWLIKGVEFLSLFLYHFSFLKRSGMLRHRFSSHITAVIVLISYIPFTYRSDFLLIVLSNDNYLYLMIWLTSLLYLASSFFEPPALDMNKLMMWNSQSEGWYLVNTLITTGGPRVTTLTGPSPDSRLTWGSSLSHLHLHLHLHLLTIITISASQASQQLQISLAEVGHCRQSRARLRTGEWRYNWESANDMKTDIICEHNILLLRHRQSSITKYITHNMLQ